MTYFSQYLHEKNIKDGAELININALEKQKLMVHPKFGNLQLRALYISGVILNRFSILKI
tara:strand:- start:1412 stop:1591 length:180 start_codon:yes stop_codon:yes gene_type:complete